jgi:hypothetical protein
MAIQYLASTGPAPLGPSSTAILIDDATDTATPAPTIDPFYTGQLGATVPTALNQVLAILALGIAFGGNGYGICTGLTLSEGTGLNVAIAAGTAMIYGPVQYAGGSYTCPDNTSRVFLWLHQNGTVTHTTTSTAPSANCVFLGSVTTSAGDISSTMDYSNVVYIKDGVLFRETADLGAPSDTPDADRRIQTKTLAGLYRWDGTAHQAQGLPTNEETLSATRTLTELDAPRQLLDPNGADRDVLLPATVNMDSCCFEIHNTATSAGWNIVVKSSDGLSTVASLANGEMIRIYPRFGGTYLTGKYPITPITPTP